MKIDPNHIPDKYLCEQCEPRYVVVEQTSDSGGIKITLTALIPAYIIGQSIEKEHARYRSRRRKA